MTRMDDWLAAIAIIAMLTIVAAAITWALHG